MKKCLLAICAALALAAMAPQAEARGIIGIGINFGIPIYPRPWCGPVYYPYYRPYPVYVAPAPIYYAPPPVIVQPAPVYQPVPVVRTQPASVGYEPPLATTDYRPQPQPTTADWRQPENNSLMQQLFAQDERTRADAAVELGRMKAQQAIDPLCTLLNTDRSPHVRDAAARGLGLIGNSRALPALQNAAQADGDRDVRRSAQFSAEVIRTNLAR